MAKIFHADPTRKGKAHWLKNMKIREVSLVDDPASPGANFILTKARGSMPSAASIAAILKDQGAVSSWPVESPTLANPGRPFVNRVSRKSKAMKKSQKAVAKAFAAEIRKGVERGDPTMLALAEKLSARIVKANAGLQGGVFAKVANGALQDFSKAAERAEATINQLAKSLDAETGMGFPRAFTEICKIQPDLYRAMRKLGRDEGTGAVPNNYSADPDDAPADNTSNDGSDLDVDGASPDESMQAINDEADRIQADTKQSRVNALLQAGQRLPGHYANSRRATRVRG